MANMVAIRDTLRYIRTHMDLWEQDSWAKPLEDGYSIQDVIAMIREDPFKPACGVTGCMAGLAVMNHGYRPVIRVLNADGYYPHIGGIEHCVETEEGPDGKLVAVGPERSIKTVAAELFDISTADATRLFDSDNTYEDLLSAADHLEAGRSLRTWIRPSDENDDYDEEDDEDYPEPDPDSDDYEPGGEWCSACGAYH